MKKIAFAVFVENSENKNSDGLIEKDVYEIEENFLEVGSVLEFEKENEFIHYQIYAIQKNENPQKVFVREITKIAKIKIN